MRSLSIVFMLAACQPPYTTEEFAEARVRFGSQRLPVHAYRVDCSDSEKSLELITSGRGLKDATYGELDDVPNDLVNVTRLRVSRAALDAGERRFLLDATDWGALELEVQRAKSGEASVIWKSGAGASGELVIARLGCDEGDGAHIYVDGTLASGSGESAVVGTRIDAVLDEDGLEERFARTGVFTSEKGTESVDWPTSSGSCEPYDGERMRE